MSERRILFEHVLEPGTGKAIELLKGQILRIEQVEGGQCADFNCFNLHDYKEFMHCGRTRTVHGFHPTTGTFMWSAPPRERAMLYILEDTVGRNDVLFPRCSAYVYEASYGFSVHTNCHDIQAEAQREYGLTPDDVHEFLQPVHVHRRRSGRPRFYDAANQQGRRPCRSAGADGRAGGAECLRRGRDAHQQFCAEAAQAHGVCRHRRRSRARCRRRRCSQASARRRISAIPRSRPTGRSAAIPLTSLNFRTRRSEITELAVALSGEEFATFQSGSSAPTSMARMTRRRCAISCSPGGRSAPSGACRRGRRSRANDGRDGESARRAAARRHLRFPRAVGARQIQIDDRHRGAAPDRAGDDRRPPGPNQRRAVQLLQLPVGRSANSRARRRKSSGYALQGHRAEHPPDRRSSPSTSSRRPLPKRCTWCSCAVPARPR